MSKQSDVAPTGSGSPSGSRIQHIRKAARHELAVWGAVALYLFICFSAVLFYGWTQGATDKAATENCAFAAIRGIVLGKFVLAGKIFGVGELPAGRPLATRVLWRATALMLVTLAFVVLEEMVLALLKGEAALDGLAEFFARGAPEIAASSFLMLLIIIPLAAMLEISRTVDPAVLREVLLKGRVGNA